MNELVNESELKSHHSIQISLRLDQWYLQKKWTLKIQFSELKKQVQFFMKTYLSTSFDFKASQTQNTVLPCKNISLFSCSVSDVQ